MHQTHMGFHHKGRNIVISVRHCSHLVFNIPYAFAMGNKKEGGTVRRKMSNEKSPTTQEHMGTTALKGMMVLKRCVERRARKPGIWLQVEIVQSKPRMVPRVLLKPQGDCHVCKARESQGNSIF